MFTCTSKPSLIDENQLDTSILRLEETSAALGPHSDPNPLLLIVVHQQTYRQMEYLRYEIRESPILQPTESELEWPQISLDSCRHRLKSLRSLYFPAETWKQRMFRSREYL